MYGSLWWLSINWHMLMEYLTLKNYSVLVAQFLPPSTTRKSARPPPTATISQKKNGPVYLLSSKRSKWNQLFPVRQLQSLNSAPSQNGWEQKPLSFWRYSHPPPHLTHSNKITQFHHLNLSKEPSHPICSR